MQQFNCGLCQISSQKKMMKIQQQEKFKETRGKRFQLTTVAIAGRCHRPYAKITMYHIVCHYHFSSPSLPLSVPLQSFFIIRTFLPNHFTLGDLESVSAKRCAYIARSNATCLHCDIYIDVRKNYET